MVFMGGESARKLVVVGVGVGAGERGAVAAVDVVLLLRLVAFAAAWAITERKHAFEQYFFLLLELMKILAQAPFPQDFSVPSV